MQGKDTEPDRWYIISTKKDRHHSSTKPKDRNS